MNNLFLRYEQNLNALLNSSSFKCHMPFLSFVMTLYYFQHESFIWREAGADIINRQRKGNILPSHKTISYRFICACAHDLSPWPPVALPAPWIFCLNWHLLTMPRERLPNCSHVLYSICILSSWVLSWRQHWKTERGFGTSAVSFLLVTQSCSHPQPDFSKVFLPAQDQTSVYSLQ